MSSAEYMTLRHANAVLALVYLPGEGHICAGCQDSIIRVWDAATFTSLRQLSGHTRAVVTLYAADSGAGDGNWFLFSSSKDNSIRVWSVLNDYACLAVIPVATGNVLHLAALPIPQAASVDLSKPGSGTPFALFAGCQNTTVTSTRMDVPLASDAHVRLGGLSSPAAPAALDWSVHSGHYGFVYAVHLRRLSGLEGQYKSSRSSSVPPAIPGADGSVGSPASPLPALQLLTGSGDGSIGVWSVQAGSYDLSLKERLAGHTGSVYALEVVGVDLFSGSQDGTIRVWDLDTMHCKQILRGHTQEVLCFAVSGRRTSGFSSGLALARMHSASTSPAQLLCSGSADTTIRLWSTRSYSCLHVLKGHTDIISAMSASSSQLFSGSTDKTIRVWDLSQLDAAASSDESTPETSLLETPRLPEAIQLSESSLMSTLRKFVAIPTVSSQMQHRAQCWNGAKFIQDLLRSIGAENKLAQVLPGKNPIVIGRLGWDPALPTITLHGHYDVMPADSPDWSSDPFHLTGEDGYVYGRGASDNKGPVLAAIYAVALSQRPHIPFGGMMDLGKESAPQLTARANFAFIFEGEGENGSEGFQETVLENKDWFAGTTLIMNNNSKWLGDDTPCLTYGLRGRLCFDLEVTGPSHDLHSGVDGGVGNEPLMDLMGVVASLLDPKTGQVLVPGFYDDVLPISDKEAALYEELAFDADKYVSLVGIPSVYKPFSIGTVPEASPAVPLDLISTHLKRARTAEPDGIASEAVGHATIEPIQESTRLLMLRWRMPALSVHSVATSAAISSVIPAKACATVSIRTVPNQELGKMESQICEHLQSVMKSRGTSNTLRLRVTARAKWWLQNPFSETYQAAAAAIEQHWGVKPNFVCEGGTLRVTPFLEEALGAPAIHFPLAQSTDNAHVANERLRITNLVIGVKVLRSLLSSLGAKVAPGP